MLSARDIQTFKEEGVVIVRDFFPAEQVAEWRRQIWADTTADASGWATGDFTGPCLSPLNGSGGRNGEHSHTTTPRARGG